MANISGRAPVRTLGLFLLTSMIVLATQVQADDVSRCRSETIDPQQSIAACSKLIKGKKPSPVQLAEYHYARGVSYRRLGKYGEAVTDFSEAIRLNPRHASAYNDRAHARGELGDKEGAIADLTRAIEIEPKFALAWANRGSTWHDMGDLDRALADLNEAIRLSTKDPVAYLHRGIVYMRKSDFPAAIRDFAEAIRLDPDNAQYYLNRG